MASATIRASTSTEPRTHIEEIRRSKFSIGAAEPNPLTEDLHNAVRNLSAELYTKDVHFLMELIQNAEDNEYPTSVNPCLEFVITSKDITGTNASSTLLVFNNEIGFSRRNVESICSVGRSTKKGKRQEGFIGEKGIGFKSVFLVTSQPYIFSNGYQIRFNEDPDPCCGIGYIVPEWVDGKPTLSDIWRVYGFVKTLPMTIIVLPLRSDKVISVKRQLSIVHPELLLFLSKIKRLSVRENNEGNNALGTVTAISISSESDFRTRKDINADSHIVYLSAQEGTDKIGSNCHYYMWRQRFPVKSQNQVEVRRGIQEWVISLAFPFGDRLKRGNSSAGIYAFLPTEMVTNFPFIIQADFILASSRETILLDNKWNRGILQCVPYTFINAFVASVKSVETAPLSSVAPTFKFLPVEASSYVELNGVRESIKNMVQAEHIVPCDSFSGNRVFCRPIEVGRLLHAFRNILLQLQKEGVSLISISSHGKYVLHSTLDLNEYNDVLGFLGITYLNYNWYTKCIQGSNAVLRASENTYLELLCFLSDNWISGFSLSTVKDLPVLKYVDQHNNVVHCSFQTAAWGMRKIRFMKNDQFHAWANKWIVEFRWTEMAFLPNSTQMALERFQKRDLLVPWLHRNAKVEVITLAGFAKSLTESPQIRSNPSQVICIAHFLCHSLAKNFMSNWEIPQTIPVVDRHGRVVLNRKVTLIPASGSKWATLLSSDPWTAENYVVLADEYAQSGQFAGERASKEILLDFVRSHIKATDLPQIWPPDVALDAAYTQLTREQAFLLLDWLRFMETERVKLPNKFMKSINCGRWLKTCSGYNSPNQSFFPDVKEKSIFSQMGNIFARFPILDVQFYNHKIHMYESELRRIGLKFGFVEACPLIVNYLLSQVEFTMLTREAAIPLLNFIRYSNGRRMLYGDTMKELADGILLKTSQGYKHARESFLLFSATEPFLQITTLPFVDGTYYGSDIMQYSSELKLLGATVDLKGAYEIIVRYCTFPNIIPPLTKEIALSLLKFIRHVKSEYKYLLHYNFLKTLKDKVHLMTSRGSTSVSSLLLISEREAVSQLTDLPFVDEAIYGEEISSYSDELKLLGVVVDVDQAYGLIANNFRFPKVLSTLTKDSVLLLLRCIKNLGATPIGTSLVSKITRQPWLKTSLGFKTPSETFFPNPKWRCLFRVIEVSLIDEAFYGSTIQAFKAELYALGVTISFDASMRKIANRFMELSSSCSLTKENVVSLLDCCKCLMHTHYSLVLEFRNILLNEKWLLTSSGYRSASESILWDSKWESLSDVANLPFIDDSYYGNDIYYFEEVLKMMGVVVDPNEGCNLVTTTIKLPTQLSRITSGFALTILEYIRSQNTIEDSGMSVARLNEKIRSQPWLKTIVGFKSPLESILSDREWGCMLHVVKVPWINKTFYGNRIQCFKSELRLLGVVVNSVDAAKIVARQLGALSSSRSLTKTSVLCLLKCLKLLKETEHSPLEEFKNSLSNEKWVKTSHGYRHACDAILFDTTWEPISQIADLPFVDEAFYSKKIYQHLAEFKLMGVVVELRDGFQLVIKNLKLPEEPGVVTAASVLSLLECVRYVLAGSSTALPDDFLRCIRCKWLKTFMGYRSPEECFLFNSKTSAKAKSRKHKKWASILEPEDAPFIDENFYGTDIGLYKEELKAMGVKVDGGDGCMLLADTIVAHTKFPVIKRIYKYLNKFKWKPRSQNKSDFRIWIPFQDSTGGEWVYPSGCVISDNDNLFISQKRILDRYYEKPLLSFFSSAFGVASLPSTDDYLELWNNWEVNPQHEVTTGECSIFWAYILSVWNEIDGENLEKRITKLPAKAFMGAIKLVDKKELFIPDDLQLEQMFTEASMESLFVWYPQPSVASIPLGRLYDVYIHFGVRKISESVQKSADTFCIGPSCQKMDSNYGLIGKGLLKLVLGFLSDPRTRISVINRHEIARLLLGLEIFETKKPITVSYNLLMPSGRSLSAKATKMVSWERGAKRLVILRKPENFDHKSSIEFAFHFARAVSEGLLWEHTDLIEGLCKLIQSGCTFDFDADAMDYLLKLENFRILVEDEEFLASAFPSNNTRLTEFSLPRQKLFKRKSQTTQSISPSQNQCKRKRR